ncbi:hypothetical protein [Curvivirga sp.]|uniref:hypothetical protein n=1 Tax=Curvivirga sp. TaxID=2856848 RepID=UPI003B58E564
MTKGFRSLSKSQQKTLKYLFRYLLKGVAFAAILCLGVFYFDLGNLWSMASAYSYGWLIVMKLFFAMAVTCAGVSMGYGMFTLPVHDDK